ncbi:hypothetical protein BH09GEM1_BH09GEM1_22610 [soil metagenome]
MPHGLWNSLAVWNMYPVARPIDERARRTKLRHAALCGVPESCCRGFVGGFDSREVNVPIFD